MAEWSKEELRKIAEADDLHVSPFREDGVTYGTPTWIWSVTVDDALYVRAYNGKNSRWYKAALRQKAGRIIAAGMMKEVTFEPVEGEASFGRYEIDEPAHSFTDHVEGALVRNLIGKDLKRVYDFAGNQLIVKSSNPDEH